MNWKRILQVSAVILVILIMALGAAVWYFPHWLQHKLIKEVQKKSGGIYTLHIKKLDASLLNSTLAIDSLVLTPNFGVWQQQQNKEAGNAGMLSALRIEKVRINHINILHVLFKKPLALDSVLLVKPHLQLTQMKKDTTSGKPLYESLDGPLKNMQVNTIVVQNADLLYKNNYKNKFNTAEIKDVNLEVNKLRLDSASFFNPKRTFYAESIAVTAAETNMLLPSEQHRLKMGVIAIGTKTRQIKMKAVQLIPLYNSRELAQHKVKRTLWLNLELPQLLFKDIDFSVYSHSGKIVVDSVLIDSPKLLAFSNGKTSVTNGDKLIQNDSSTAAPLFKSLSGPLVKMQINSIRVRNADCRYKDKPKDNFNTIELNALNLQVNKLALDSASFYNPNRTFYAESITLNAAKTDFLMQGGYYRLKSDAANLNTSAREINFARFRLEPVYSPKEMSQRKKRSTVWMKLEMPKARFQDVNFPAFSRSGNVFIGSITAERPFLKAFNDKKHFSSHTGIEKLFPQDIVQHLKMGLDIGKFQVRKMRVRYDEFDEKASRPGYITMQDFNCTIRNITNNKSKMSAKNPAVMQVNFVVNGQAKMHMTSRLNLLDPNCRHSISGGVGTCDLRFFNTIMAPTMAVRIKSGTLNKGTFNMNLSRNKASGEMLLLYKDFKIQMLNADGKGQSIGNKITSFFANAFVVKSENPEKGEPPRKVAISITKNKADSFITYWRDCLQDGFMTSVGVGSSKP